jgi:hypothetical protein
MNNKLKFYEQKQMALHIETMLISNDIVQQHAYKDFPFL